MTNLAVYTSQWDDSQIELIKQQIAQNCTDDELALFGLVCKQTGLNPFNRQIYAIKRNQWNAATKTNESKMTIQISIDGHRVMAARTGRHLCTAISWCGQDGQWVDIWLSEATPAAAKAEVWVKGCDRPFVAVAKFNSYKQANKEGKLTSTWEKMPDVMISKCAESLALRMAFPGVFAAAPDANHQPSMEAVDITSEPIAELVEAEYAETGAEEIAAFKAQVQKLFKLCKISGGDRTQWAIDLHGVASPHWTRDQWEIGVADLQSRFDLVDSFERSQAA
jgi:phage recombination protein Bet